MIAFVRSCRDPREMKRHGTRVAGALIAGLTLPVAPLVFAADPPQASNTEKPTVLPPVQVEATDDTTSSATRTDTPLRDVPQYINTIPQQLLKSQGATSL